MAVLLKLSTKGQIVIPSATRRAHRWTPETAIEMVDRPDGVLIREVAAHRKLPFDEALARLREAIPERMRGRPAVSVEEMNSAVAAYFDEQPRG